MGSVRGVDGLLTFNNSLKSEVEVERLLDILMFSPVLIFCLAVTFLLVLSVRQRLVNLELKERAWDGSETKSSPLSNALTGLIGTAGGIYLSLAMLISFMELNVPSKVNVFSIGLEPLAAISFALAIIQPFLIRLWYLRKKI